MCSGNPFDLVIALAFESKIEYGTAAGLAGIDCPCFFGGAGTNGPLINLALNAYTILTLMSAFVRFSCSAS